MSGGQTFVTIFEVSDKWSVLFLGHSSLVSSLLPSDPSNSFSALSFVGGIHAGRLIQVIKVEAFKKSFQLTHVFFTLGRSSVRLEIVEEENTVVGHKEVVDVVRDHVEIVDSVWERWANVILPVCGAVSYGKAFKGNDVLGLVPHSLVQVVVVNLPGEVGHIDSSIRLS